MHFCLAAVAWITLSLIPRCSLKPTLYRDYNGNIGTPTSARNVFGNDELEYEQYAQYALLDIIEFFVQNCKDVTIGSFHSYWGHHHLNLLETRKVFDNFRVRLTVY